MVLYVKGDQTKFWHWCKNCENYPSDIKETTTQEPTENLCPICYEKDSDDGCDKGKTKEPPIGFAVVGGKRRGY